MKHPTILALAIALLTCGAEAKANRHYRAGEGHRLKADTADNRSKAIAAYGKGCKARHGLSCYRLALYLDRPGNQALSAAAKKKQEGYYKKACRYGMRDACIVPIVAQFQAARTARQREQVARRLGRHCRRGSAIACYVVFNLQKALHQRKQKAGKLSTAAQRRWWKRRKKLLKRLKSLLERGCGKGIGEHCFTVAYLYFSGDLRGGRSLAARRFGQGCTAKHANACDFLAIMHGGGLGIAKSLKKARSFHQRACKLGLSDGCTHYGGLLFRGLGGPQDLSKARSLFARSCGWNHSRACLLLGEMVIRGEGGSRDVNRALRLYQKSCKLGLAPSCQRAKSLKAVLDANKKKKAQQRRPRP